MSTSRTTPRLAVTMLALVTLLVGFLIPLPADAQTAATEPDVVISQVYGGGGNSGATYTHDFVEVFNRGDAAVDLTGWSVQYAAASGTTWQVTPLSGALEPGQYFLVQQAQGAGGTTPLPTPDASGSIAMAASNGKVALVDGSTALTGACPLESVVDLVGFGTANCFEGSGATPALSNTTAALRAGEGCVDTDDNAADFTVGAPAPRNTASPLNPCEDDGGGTDPDLGAEVVISQAYGGGGNSGATYTHDFVEVFNRGDAAVDLTGWSVQYASTSGTTWQVTSLSGTLEPGQYFLVQQAQGAGGTTPLPTPDASGSIAMAAANGKVALVDGSTALTGACPLESVVDLVGFGTANCFEGSGATPALSNTTAALRAGEGCVDTDDNAADFTVGAPAPRNTASPLNPCGAPLGPLPVISQVYGGGGNSGATYTHDFIEVFNRGDAAVDLTGWSVQYASTSGTTWQVTSLSGTLEPGQYFLVQQAQGAGGTTPLPTPDASGSIAMAAANGKVALVDGSTALTGACPLESVVDLVGFGTANCFEGSGATPALSNTTAALRAGEGCVDTDDNAADFTVGAPAPRNTASPLNPCGGTPPPPNEPVLATCQDLTVATGESGSVGLSATDADGTVVEATITSSAFDGIALANAAPATEPGGTFTVDLTVGDSLVFGSYDVEVTFSNDDPSPQQDSCTMIVTVQGDICDAHPTLTVINEIQGDGATTPIDGKRVVTRGIVTSDVTPGGQPGIEAGQGLNGFFIEAVTADRDENPQTSEGLFVYYPGESLDAEVDDLVYVAGTAGEGFGVTQVTATDIVDCGDVSVDTTLPPPAMLPMPTAPGDRAIVFEPLESMRVTHPELTVTDFWQLERFGEVFLSSGGVRPNPTNVVDPHDEEAYESLLAANAANTILLDDGRSGQNLDPLPYVEPGDTLRIGDQLRDHATILHFGFGSWRLQPISIDAITQEFQDNRTRPRPETPPEVGGSLTIASFNVLNYFNGDGYFVGDETAAGFPTARGALTPSEFERQTAKIVDAIVRMDADIVGLIEIENDEGPRQAAAALVDAVNTTLEHDVYDYLDTGTIGTDAIKLAYIYKPSTVELTGDYAILDSSVDPRFVDTRSRPVLTQTFTERLTGSAVTVSVNHLKSKGQSSLTDTSNPDYDQDDGQGFWNVTRTAAAAAMADWLATNPTGQEAAGHLIIGDLNAYAKEDPIVALQEAGYTDLLDLFAPEGVMPYTYTFSATQGYLDHALADGELFDWVTGATAWNINADEVPAIDYQEGGPGRFRTVMTGELYYQSHAFRSSDHDPVLLGFGLPPGARDVCLKGGWRLQNLTFRNQGQCLAYVATQQGDDE
jgi:uncharacterized protein